MAANIMDRNQTAIPPLPEGFTLDSVATNQIPPLPEGFTLDMQPQAPKTVRQQLQDAFPSSRLDKVAAIQDRVRKGEQSQFGGGLAVLGEGLQQQGEDIVGAVSPYIPDFVKQGAATVAGGLSSLGTNIGESLPAGGQDFVVNRANEVSSGVNYLNKNYPVTMSELKGGLQIANTVAAAVPIGGVTAKAINYTADAANVVKKGGNLVKQGASAAAIKTGLAKPAPQIASDFVNPTGLTAIEEINKGYGVAKDAVNSAEKLVRAKAVPIQSANLLDNIDNTINNLADKVAIGSKEQAALAQLSRIRDNLKNKNGLPDTNDLIDIRAAINAGLPVNKFPVAGVGDKLNLKLQVDDLLGNVSKEVPEFGDAYKNYRAAATDIASRFTGNKKLKNFWQPEDYTAYKAFKNGNAELPYNDATLGRANQFLDKLNTQDTGQINAVVKAMPMEVAEAVLKAASKRADSLNPNIIRALGSAVMNLKSGNVAGAVRNVVSDMVTPSKPNLVKDYYNLYKKNPNAANAKLTPKDLKGLNPVQIDTLMKARRVEPTTTPRNAVKKLLKDEQGSVPPAKLPIRDQARLKGTKVVDDKGQPITVYHGTDAVFDEFDDNKGVHWFTSDKAAIERGEVGASTKGNIKEGFINIKKLAGWDEYDKYSTDELINMGYDGVKLDNDYIIFSGKQFVPNAK